MLNFGETWVEDESAAYPSGGMKRKALVRCPDGKLRRAYAGIADTFFSLPARCRPYGRGCIMIENDELHFYVPR